MATDHTQERSNSIEAEQWQHPRIWIVQAESVFDS